MKVGSEESVREQLFLVVAVAVVSALVLVLGGGEPSAAQAAKPTGGSWCGMTNDGGSVRLEVTSDGRWLTKIDIRTSKGTASSSETSHGKTQIVTSKFIFRSGSSATRSGSSGRCIKPPCRSTVAPTSSAMIRGTFRSADSLRGSYTALTTSVSPSGRPGNVRRFTGTYVAWPAGMAPCP